MVNNHATQQSIQAVKDEPELVFDTDELQQLAKFLDALLEADLANQPNARIYQNGGNLQNS
jgi:hypothetical protein